MWYYCLRMPDTGDAWPARVAIPLSLHRLNKLSSFFFWTEPLLSIMGQETCEYEQDLIISQKTRIVSYDLNGSAPVCLLWPRLTQFLLESTGFFVCVFLFLVLVFLFFIVLAFFNTSLIQTYIHRAPEDMQHWYSLTNFICPWGCTFGGVYVPCICTHARWELP